MSEERSSLLDKMLGNGAAAGLRGKANEREAKLTAAGLEHKAAKPQGEANKGLIDAMRAKVETFVGQLMSSAPDGLVDGIMAIVTQSAMETPALSEPVIEETPVEEMAEGEEIIVEDEDEEEELEADVLEDEEEKALAQKATGLFDSLITSQEGLVTDMGTITKAVEELKPLLALVAQVDTLTKEVSALKRQLSNRPRIASRASETEIETDELSPEIQKHLTQKSSFWGASLAPEGV